jgi:multidrug efflux pump subunit AcrA (membrane-fusion protein)
MKHKLFKQGMQMVFLMLFLPFIFGCNDHSETEEETMPEAKTPVSITKVQSESISEDIELKATSVFQKKVEIKANMTGYLEDVNLIIGQEISQGQQLFTIRSKEAQALGTVDIIKDTSLNFSGLVKIKAQKSGVLTTLDHQKGDYVQEGDRLGTISERSSLVFILEVPFELHNLIKINNNCEIVLPDYQVIPGKITGSLPTVDPVSQTQSYVVTAVNMLALPENLSVKIRIVKSAKEKAIVLPKQAVLSDETQTEFWVMKLINDSVAIKIPIKKGIETTGKVEIAEPTFSDSDRIILEGNYGLADTAKITVQKVE